MWWSSPPPEVPVRLTGPEAFPGGGLWQRGSMCCIFPFAQNFNKWSCRTVGSCQASHCKGMQSCSKSQLVSLRAERELSYRNCKLSSAPLLLSIISQIDVQDSFMFGNSSTSLHSRITFHCQFYNIFDF